MACWWTVGGGLGTLDQLQHKPNLRLTSISVRWVVVSMLQVRKQSLRDIKPLPMLLSQESGQAWT